jgi:hypothetical protein
MERLGLQHKADAPALDAAAGARVRAESLRAALAAAGHPAAQGAIEPMRDKGLAHDHFLLAGSGLVARVPKQSQMGLPAAAALAYEAACFERAAASGLTPVLHGVLPPSAHLARGALLVAHVDGRPARLPAELPAVARTLASVHALPLPPAAGRPPLLDPGDALLDLLHEVERLVADADAGPVPAVARRALVQGLDRLRAALAQPRRPQRCLIAFDAHPGNFLVDGAGRAWLVDLEKCRYSHPGLDLAHATLYTSTTWDVDSRTTLEPADVLAFHAAWERTAGPALAIDARPWHGLLRRSMWLWSLAWCARWRVLSDRPPAADGEDWSSQRSDPALVAHVRERVDHYLSREAVERVLDELAVLDAEWAR